MEPWPDDNYAFLTGEDIPDVTPEADLIGGEELPPEARKCPESVRNMIRVAHRNLGHPSNHALVRVMKIAKCHPDMLAYARSMRCPTCIRRKPPERIPRTTMPYRPTRFNALVGLDLKWTHDSSITSHLVLNILDLATTYNIGIVVPNQRPETIAKAFKAHWIQLAETP